MKVFDLEFNANHYYIKRSSIVEKIIFDNRTFYTKFERIDKPLSSLVLKQHLNRQYTIAVPLLENGYTNYLVLDYKAQEYKRFKYLTKHLFLTMGISEYYIYQGKKNEHISIFIKVDNLSLDAADIMIRNISEKLKTKITKKWKLLPSALLPDAYNIITLPYDKETI